MPPLTFLEIPWFHSVADHSAPNAAYPLPVRSYAGGVTFAPLVQENYARVRRNFGGGMQFDARAAKILAAGDHLIVPDAPGLRLVASTTGRAWIYRYKSPLDGGMRQLKLGQWPAMSVSAAVVEWERRKADRDAGRCPATEKRAARHEGARRAAELRQSEPAKRHTVRALVADFIAQDAAHRRKPKGLAELRRTMDTMLGEVGEMLPSDITRSVAYGLISSYQATPVQAANLRRDLGAAWDWGHDSGKLGEDVPNWWRQILRGKLRSKGKIVGGVHQGTPVKRVLTVSEVGQVLRHLPHLSRLPAELLTLYLWTGCRGAEICAIEGREVSQERDGWWWTIPKDKLKTASHPLTTDLRVPLVGRALDIVLARMDAHGSGHLYPPQRGKANHVDQKVVGVAVWWHMPGCTLRPEQARPRWPVVDWAPHDLRRTVRTQLAAMRCPREVAEAILGHLLPGVEGVYNRHQYDAERREWITRLAACWEAAAASR